MREQMAVVVKSPPFSNARLQGVRQRKTAYARKRKKHGENLLNRNTCEGSSRR